VNVTVIGERMRDFSVLIKR